jgi:hypothetical protein
MAETMPSRSDEMEAVALRNAESDQEKEKLSEFAIGIMINDGSSTDALYANGNQRCKVFIRVLKEARADKDSPWQVAPLSASERQSLTVLPYSNELLPSQAPGWYCDLEASDKYDEGLWRGTSSVGLRGSTSTTSAGANTAAEEFYRYMRFDGKLTSIQPTTFMACITLDDQKRQYTTHFSDGNREYESSITITPQRPYVLHVNDLGLARQDAYSAESGRVTVDTYYWALPGGLRIVNETFNDVTNSSDKLVYAYAKRDGSKFRLGMAIKRDVTTLTLRQIDGVNTAASPEANIPLINSDSMLRAARYYSDGRTNNNSNYDKLIYWTITDNYGCDSRFVLKINAVDQGATLELLNG